jgi:DNA-binding transcriptional MerR regulator
MQYSIKAAAMATGVTEGRLRTWERRYGIPQPDRSASGHRKFTDDDLYVIRRMAALIDSGMSAAEAADAAGSENGEERPEPVTPQRANPLVDLFLQKARDMDEGWMVRIVRDSVFSSGWAPTMERVVFPSMRRLTGEWGEARVSIAHVKYAMETVRAMLSAELVKLGPVEEPRARILLAASEDDQYDLAALALTLLLRLVEVKVYFVGRSVGCHCLIEAAKQLLPDAVVIVGTRRASPGNMNRCARAIVGSKLPSQLFVGGSVLTRRDAPQIPGIHLPQSLVAAAERIESTVAR